MAWPLALGPSLWVIGGLLGFGGGMGLLSHHIYQNSEPAHYGYDENGASEHKRRAIGETHTLMQINATDLRGRDFAKLQDMRIDFMSPGVATISTNQFSVPSNVTMYPQDDARPGLVKGDISFQIPDLDGTTSGTFVLLNQTAADNKTKEVFEMIYTSVTGRRDEISDLGKTIEKMVGTIPQQDKRIS